MGVDLYLCGFLGNEVLQSVSPLLLRPRYVYGVHIKNMHLNSLFIFSIQIYALCVQY